MTSTPRHDGRRQTAAWVFYWGSLLTLPWVGVGLAHLVTGRDLGGGLQPAWALAAASLALSVPELRALWARQRGSWLRGGGPFLVAVLVSGLGLWLAPGTEGGTEALLRFIKQIIQLLLMLMFVVLPVMFMGRGRSLAALALPIVLGGLLQALYGLGQGIHHYAPLPLMSVLEQVSTSNPAILAGSERLYLGNELRDIPRLRGMACEPLYLGNYLLLAIPLVACVSWSRGRKLWAVAALVLLLAGTWSRGAWLGAGIGVVAALLLAHRAGVSIPWRRLLLAGLGGVVLMAALHLLARLADWTTVTLPWQRLQQSFSTVDWSNLTRLYSMQAAWRAFLLSPIVGIGWGQFGFHFAALVDPLGLQSMFTWPVVNNFALAILCETGVVGLAAALWAMRCLVRAVVGRGRSLAVGARLPVVLLSAGSLAIGAQLLTFSQYNLPHIWTAGGLLLGVATASGTGGTEGEG